MPVWDGKPPFDQSSDFVDQKPHPMLAGSWDARFMVYYNQLINSQKPLQTLYDSISDFIPLKKVNPKQ